jgi:hypothetical protein
VLACRLSEEGCGGDIHVAVAIEIAVSVRRIAFLTGMV